MSPCQFCNEETVGVVPTGPCCTRCRRAFEGGIQLGRALEKHGAICGLRCEVCASAFFGINLKEDEVRTFRGQHTGCGVNTITTLSSNGAWLRGLV